MTEARFLFLLTEGFKETVIDSQVVDPVVLLGREGIDFDLLALVNGRPSSSGEPITGNGGQLSLHVPDGGSNPPVRA